MDWLLEELGDSFVYHVWPEHDTREHCTNDDDLNCWCGPCLERHKSGSIIVIHNSKEESDNLVAGIMKPH